MWKKKKIRKTLHVGPKRRNALFFDGKTNALTTSDGKRNALTFSFYANKYIWSLQVQESSCVNVWDPLHRTWAGLVCINVTMRLSLLCLAATYLTFVIYANVILITYNAKKWDCGWIHSSPDGRFKQFSSDSHDTWLQNSVYIRSTFGLIFFYPFCWHIIISDPESACQIHSQV